KELDAPAAVRDSDRHRRNHLLCLDRDAAMNHEAIQSTQTTRANVSAGIFGFRLERFRQMCRKNRRGAAVVEFALISPLFFLLILGMVEYGRLVMVQQILTNASREGARMAVLDGATKASVEN